MEIPIQEVHKIKTAFSIFIETAQKPWAPESQRKISEIARVFFRWVKMHSAREFLELPGDRTEDLTRPASFETPLTLGPEKLEEAIPLAPSPINRSYLAIWRDPAAGASLRLRGARAHAAGRLPVCAVHLNEAHPYSGQRPKWGVHTKNHQGANPCLNAIPEPLAGVGEWAVFEWAKYPRPAAGCAPDYSSRAEQSLSTSAGGCQRRTALHKRLGRLFERAGRLGKAPHKFRHAYAIYGRARCESLGE